MQRINRIRRIVTHKKPHLDEIFAIELLRMHGENDFPGVSTAPIEFWEPAMAETRWQDHLADGTLLIGVGNGRFDEHAGQNRERKVGHTASSLVAAALHLKNDQAVQRMLEYVVPDDLQGSAGPFSLATLIVTMYGAYEDDPHFVIDWALVAIRTNFSKQEHFFDETMREYEERANVTKVRRRNGKCAIVSIESDDPQIASLARSKYGNRASVVIQRKSNGQILISANKGHGVKLKDVARLVRMEELKAKGIAGTDSWKDLEVEGTLPQVPEWHYFEVGAMVMNGSNTHPDVPATRLSLEQVTDLVQIALSVEFEPSHESSCLIDECTNRIDPCIFYPLGLLRCRSVRFKEQQRLGQQQVG